MIVICRPGVPESKKSAPTFPGILQDWREDVAEIKETAEARFYNSEEPLTHGEL